MERYKKIVAYISPVKSKQPDEQQMVLAGENIFADCYNELAQNLNGRGALGAVGDRNSSVSQSASVPHGNSEYQGFAGKREAPIIKNDKNKIDSSIKQVQSQPCIDGTSSTSRFQQEQLDVTFSKRQALCNDAYSSRTQKPVPHFGSSSVDRSDKFIPELTHNSETLVNADDIASVEDILDVSDESILRYISQLAADFDEEQHCDEQEIKRRSRNRQALIQHCLEAEVNEEHEDIDTAIEPHVSDSEIPDTNQLVLPTPLFDSSLHKHASGEAKRQPLLPDPLPSAAYGLAQDTETCRNGENDEIDWVRYGVNECQESLRKLDIGSDRSAQLGSYSRSNSMLGVSQSRAQALLNNNTSCLIIIDGTDLALGHGRRKCFSCRGIDICIRYFLMKGYRQVFALVPQWRLCQPTPDTPITDQHLLLTLYEQGHIQYIPSKKIGGKRIIHQEDRVILKLAAQSGGIVVSNKHYNHIWEEVEQWRSVIENRVLMYKFVGDILLIPEDPLGRDGPRLDDFLCRQQPAPPVAYGYHGMPGTYAPDSYRHNSPAKGARGSMERMSPARTSHTSTSSPHDLPVTRTKYPNTNSPPATRSRTFSPQMPARAMVASPRGFGEQSRAKVASPIGVGEPYRAMTSSPRGYGESVRGMMSSPKGYGERAMVGSLRGQGERLSWRQRHLSSPTMSSAYDNHGPTYVDTTDTHRHLWVSNYSITNTKQAGMLSWD